MVQVVILLSHINDYVSIRQDLIAKGEKIFKAGGVLLCHVEDMNLRKVFALVAQTAEIPSAPYELNMSLLGDPKDWKCLCSCKAGQNGLCEHVVAALIHINRFEDLEFISTKERIRQLDKTCLSSLCEPTKVEDLCHPRRKIKTIEYELTPEMEENIRENFAKAAPNSLFAFHYKRKH